MSETLKHVDRRGTTYELVVGESVINTTSAKGHTVSMEMDTWPQARSAWGIFTADFGGGA